MTEEQQNNQDPITESGSGSANSKLSIVAVVLSVAALLTSIMEVNFVRQELRSEAWPYLELRPAYSAEGYRIALENKGVGPARLRSLSFTLDGQPLTDLDQAIIDTIGKENAFSYDLYSVRNPAPGVLSSGEQVVLFAVPWERRTRLLVDVWANSLKATACYCSIYDDCWIAKTGQGDPVSVSMCDE